VILFIKDYNNKESFPIHDGFQFRHEVSCRCIAKHAYYDDDVRWSQRISFSSFS